MNFILFPTQLYNNITNLYTYENIYLIEEPRYFIDFKFHKLKLAYHRATMKNYYDLLKKNKVNVKYINYDQVNKQFYKSLKEIIFYDPYDNKLLVKLKKIINCIILPQQQFLISNEDIINNKYIYFKNGKYHNDLFYKFMRKKFNILIDDDGKPIGGKWSFDSENRKKLPNNIDVPEIINTNNTNNNNSYIVEAIDYINNNFKDNYGSLDNFIYPIEYNSSIDWLDNFLNKKLNNFGPYEDAFHTNYDFIFHSILTPMMNIGLLTDNEVISRSIKYYNKHSKNINLASFEGFIRQIIGWRTYIYAIYILDGDKLYNANQLGNNKKISEKWWKSVNIEPIDFLINKIIKYSYVHHIERLMYLSSWMLMNNIKPKEVYRIFMEWTIDAYEWVMIPNVFGMGQFSSNIMMTRPYFSSSNYILKMSNFKKGEWCHIWDAVYYAFINKHLKLLSSNYATAMQVKHWKNKNKIEQTKILKIAKQYNKSI
jgi:deoxyribodipyrimidine photolyase-related protein